MKITDSPCKECSKRSAECRLSCIRYKVYHTAKLKEYDKRHEVGRANGDIKDHFRVRKEGIRKRSIKFTPTSKSKMKEC